jgi:lantibiotic modifying enzyme
VRLIYRDTQIYGALLTQLSDPRYLRDGVDRSIGLEALGLAQMPPPEFSWEGQTKSRLWPILAEEQRAMQQMDIPFFSVRANSDGLTLASGELIEGCFREPSFDLVVARLQSLCEQDLERQLGFISGSLYAYVARDPRPASIASPAYRSCPTDSDERTQREACVKHALRIAEEIDRRALRAANGSASWIAPQYMYWAQRYQFQPIGPDLYSGACGVALFLAAGNWWNCGACVHRLRHDKSG